MLTMRRSRAAIPACPSPIRRRVYSSARVRKPRPVANSNWELGLCNNTSPLDPDPEWLNSLETIASRAAMVIDNAVTFDSLQRSNLELMLTCDQMIEALARAADMHEGDSEGQTLGVAEQTLALARLLD